MFHLLFPKGSKKSSCLSFCRTPEDNIRNFLEESLFAFLFPLYPSVYSILCFKRFVSLFLVPQKCLFSLVCISNFLFIFTFSFGNIYLQGFCLFFDEYEVAHCRFFLLLSPSFEDYQEFMSVSFITFLIFKLFLANRKESVDRY